MFVEPPEDLDFYKSSGNFINQAENDELIYLRAVVWAVWIDRVLSNRGLAAVALDFLRYVPGVAAEQGFDEHYS